MNKNIENNNFFSIHVEDYKGAKYWRYDEEYISTNIFEPCKKKKLLVVGCGAGRTLPHLVTKGFDITAIDIVSEMVDAAKRNTSNLPIDIYHMDACNMSFQDEFFDYVFFPFHGIDGIYPDIYDGVMEIYRVMKPGGVFVFNSHNRLYIKAFRYIFQRYADYEGLYYYRTSYLDYFRLKKIFKKVKIIQRITLQPLKNSNWKDIVYKIFSPLSKSTYFICRK